MNSLIFVILLFIPWLAQKDARLYYVDFLSMLTFGGFYFLWAIPAIQATSGMMFGYDKLLHVLGGSCAALFASCFIDKFSVHKQVTLMLGTVFIVGGIWEIFEWIFGQLPEPYHQSFNGWRDSAWDVAADLLGGLIIVLRRLLKDR